MEVRERPRPEWVKLGDLKRGDTFRLQAESLVYILFENVDRSWAVLCLVTGGASKIDMDRMVLPVNGYFQVEEG